jgi:hypothetical protein
MPEQTPTESNEGHQNFEISRFKFELNFLADEEQQGGQVCASST